MSTSGISKTLTELRDFLIGPDNPVADSAASDLVSFPQPVVSVTQPVTLRSLQKEVEAMGDRPAAWVDKMVHRIQPVPTTDRIGYILKYCRGRKVLNLGSSSGGLHDQIMEVASSVFGVDREEGADLVCDLDKEPDNLMRCLGPRLPFEVIVAGEIIEHLRNPGNLLDSLALLMAGHKTVLIVTVPNNRGIQYQKIRGLDHEIVNNTHVAWYSYVTLTNLLELSGLTVVDRCCYNGRKLADAEGLIFSCVVSSQGEPVSSDVISSAT